LEVVDQTITRSNQLLTWLRQLDGLRLRHAYVIAAGSWLF
jgi:hypothetical protein